MPGAGVSGRSATGFPSGDMPDRHHVTADLIPVSMDRSRRRSTASPYGPARTSHLRGSPSRDVVRDSLTFTHHPKTAGRRPQAEKPWPPAGLLLACGPRMGHGPLRLLPRAPHPAVTRDARRGGDGPTRTGPGTTPPTPAGPPTAPPT